MPLIDELPGEWYVDLISLGRPGKTALHFLHHPTKVVVLVKGRSLRKSYAEFTNRVRNFLVRHDYEALIDRFGLSGEFEIFPTNDRGMISTMNQIKWNSEYHCKSFEDPDIIDYDQIEDFSINYLFTSKETGKRYLQPGEILNKLLREVNDKK